MMLRLTVRCLLGICVWLCCANASAQDAPAVPTPPGITENKTDTVIRQAPLNAIILYNPDSSKSIVLPGAWQLTDLDDLYRKLLADNSNPAPPFTISNVSATGKVAGNYVETHIKIEFSTNSSRQFQIPLGFKEGILPSAEQTSQPPFRYTGTGTAELTVDTQDRQYVAIITPQVPQANGAENRTAQPNPAERPETARQHSISLLLWFPLAPNGGEEKRLSLSFPQSNSSHFLLEVPMGNVEASVTRGVMLDEQESAGQQSTLLRIQGLRTDTEITWKKRKLKITDDRPVLLVEGATVDVRLKVRSTIYEAVLPVSSTTGSFDQLQIRLPKGSTLDREMADRYAAAGDYSVGAVNGESVVTIRFPQKITEPVPIHLRVTQEFAGDKPDFRRELAGFEVLGAERQTGILTVSMPSSEMKPHWELVRGMRRTEGTGPGTAGAARFEFIAQPFLLNVQVVSPKNRINVKPEYQYHISRGFISLTARLSYTVSGSKADVLYLLLQDSDWHCDFGTSGIVETGSVELDESGLLTIPLSSPREGTFDIEFRARRAITANGEQKHRVVLPIPKPQGVTWSEPASVIIVPMNNVEVLSLDETSSDPSPQRTVGLTRQTRRTMSPIRIDLTDLQQEPLWYRAESADAVFVADLVFHQQKINATMRTDVQLLGESNQITQTISYNASYALVERVHFLLPRSLDTSGNIQVRWGSRTLELRDTVPDPQESVPENWVRKLVHLPEPAFQFQLTFQYSLPPLAVSGEDTVPFSLSFICPSGVPASEHSIHFFMPAGYKAGLQNESKMYWESYREFRRPSANVTEAFRSVQSPMRIALLISASERSLSGMTIVERAWLQTWLAGTIRRDRAVYRLRSTNDSVSLQLPPDSMREHRVIVQVDRRQIQPNISATGLLTIPILPEQHNRPIEVSVDYRYTFEMSGFAVPIILPYFTKDTLTQSQFWQVILQHNQHIIGCPEGWTLEYDWAWNGLFWWRVPSIRKSDVGFQPDSAADTAASEGSQYVFSHIQLSPYVTLYIVRRSLIIFCLSSAALLIGLVLIYVPQARYAGSLLGLAIMLTAVLLYHPPLALLMLQAAAFGVFLALGMGYVYRIFHRQKQWIPPAFPAFDDMSQPYSVPVPPSQVLHEVVMDSESTDKDAEPSAVNGNGQL